MAISRSFCTALVFLSFALFLVCVADEANKKDDKSNTKTIRGNDVKTRILGRSGKILIARSENDDNDEGKGKGNGKKDRDVEDMKDNSGDAVDSKDSVDGKDSVDRKDPDSKGDRDDADDRDDKDDDDFKDDNEDLLSFQLDEIKEKDSDDNDVDDKHSVDSFDDVNFKFSQVRTNFRFQGIPAINVNLSANLDDPNAKLDIMVFLFLQAGTITFGNETFAVQTGTVKFNIKISDWDFCGDSSSLSCSQGRAGEYLDLKLKIKSKGSPAEVDDDDRKKANKKPVCDDKDDDKDDRNDNDDDDDDDDDCPIIYNMGGDSEMLLNKGVMTDDNDYTAMPAGFPKIEYDDGETKFVFRIPKFRNNVVLDPSVTPGEKSRPAANAASWLQINVTFALLLQLAAMFAAHY